MKPIISILCWLSCISGWTQQPEPLLFRESVWDFGTIREENGPVEHEFFFRNASGNTVTITNVTTSCGCTTPTWTEGPIEAGRNGSIKVRFDPDGRPGYFSKEVSITTEPPARSIILVIKGGVVIGHHPPGHRLEHANGNLRTHTGTLQMGKIFINKPPATNSFRLENSGKKTIQITKVIVPAHIQATYPHELRSGEQGILTLRYDAHRRNTFGYVSDMLTMVTNDPISPEKSYVVTASVQEHFEPVHPSKSRQVPRLVISSKEVVLADSIAADSEIDFMVKLTNTGGSDLHIRAIVPNCPCISTEASPRKIEPGKSAMLAMRFSPNGRTGNQFKAVLLYTNDPYEPIQRITLSATVREP